MKIGITGATGQLGRLVVRKLTRRVPAQTVLALARDAAKATGLGVAVHLADYDRPDTLRAALDGVDTLLLISSSQIGQRARQHENVLDAARASGVRRVVYTSLLRADSSPLSLAAEHRATEEALAASGLAFTVLRNGWYTENYTASLAAAVQAGALVGSAGQGRISAATRADYADAAVAALTTEGLDGRVLELAGDDAWTLADLAAEVSRHVGRAVPYRDLPEGDYAGILASFGLPDAFARAIASWDVAASGGALYEDGGELSRLIGRPTTPLATAVADALRG